MILKKLQKVCDTLGCTKRGHTIEKQIDYLTEYLEGVGTSTDIASALHSLSKVSGSIAPEPPEPGPEPTPPSYTVVTFTGDGSVGDPWNPAYEANKYYTESSGEYTLLTSDTEPVNWGTDNTFYTLDT